MALENLSAAKIFVDNMLRGLFYLPAHLQTRERKEQTIDELFLNNYKSPEDIKAENEAKKIAEEASRCRQRYSDCISYLIEAFQKGETCVEFWGRKVENYHYDVNDKESICAIERLRNSSNNVTIVEKENGTELIKWLVCYNQ